MSIKKIVGWIVVLGVVAAAAIFAPAPAPEPTIVQGERGQPGKDLGRAQAPQTRLSELPAREALGTTRGDLFPARSWTARPAPAPATSGPTVAPAPSAPPMPYRVAGQVMHDGSAHIVLARGDAVLIVREGETLDGGYKVESIRADRVTLLYEPLGVRDHLVVPGGAEAPQVTTTSPTVQPRPLAADARPAQLRWEGPERVRAGTTFDVALKLTSEQPLRASPLQLSFDAAVLEPVEVRAGRYFYDGSFTYRVNPAGSIFVGASGKGSVATDAELIIVSFKPIRSGTTELKLSSVLLQGEAGRAIVHDQPAAFRTAIIQ